MVFLPFNDGWREDVHNATMEFDARVEELGVGLDEGQSESLPERVGDLDSFLAKATHAPVARSAHTHPLGGPIVYIFGCAYFPCSDSRRKRN